MMVAMVAEGFKIHERQREMKEQLNNLDDLRSIREMVISEDEWLFGALGL